jgi:flagellar FliL protein
MDTTNEDYKTYSETMSDREGLIKDVIFEVIGNYTMEEIQSDTKQVKSEILEKIQELFNSEFIYSVSFNFLYS